MKKTLIITLEHPPQVGGIASYVHKFADTLTPENTFVYAPTHKGSEEWDAKQHYTIFRKKPFFPRILWPRWVRMYLHVKKIVKSQGIERIMVHHVLPVGYVAMLIKMFKKVPYVVFSHGTDVAAGTASGWKKRMVSLVSGHADEIVFNSESLKRRFLREFPDFDMKSVILYPCPDDNFLVPPPESVVQDMRSRYALQGKQVILSVGRMVDGKGFPHLLRMIPSLLKRVPHLVWIVIGDGPKKQDMMHAVQKQSLQNVVRFFGSLPHAELKPFYYLADMFALLTHPDEGREEGLGLVFLEAAAAGLPVVAGQSGGVEEAVAHEETGYVFDVNAGLKDIEDSIVKLLNDKEVARTMGQKGQDRIKREFVWNQEVGKLSVWLQ